MLLIKGFSKTQNQQQHPAHVLQNSSSFQIDQKRRRGVVFGHVVGM
jgi:hypothetical protein